MNKKSSNVPKVKKTKKIKRKRNTAKLWKQLDKKFNQKEDLELVYNNAKIEKKGIIVNYVTGNYI